MSNFYALFSPFSDTISIVTEHVKLNDSALGGINLNNATILFDYIKDIDLDLLTINKKCTKTVSYEIGYITMLNIKGQDIDVKIPLYLRFSEVDAYFTEKNENKYLVFALTENIKKILGLYKRLWSKIKKQVKTINSAKSIKYKKDFMKIKVDSNDDLPFNKISYITVLAIIVKSVFQIKNYYYPQIFIG